MKNWNGTKGLYTIEEKETAVGYFYKVSAGSVSICNITTRDLDVARLNAELISDAGNTIQKCGLLPSQILSERDQLLETLNNLVIKIKLPKSAINEANELINKIQNGKI